MDKELRQITVLIYANDYMKLEELAKETERGLSQLVRRLFKNACQNEKVLNELVKG